MGPKRGGKSKTADLAVREDEGNSVEIMKVGAVFKKTRSYPKC